jgi:hypothetical protein
VNGNRKYNSVSLVVRLLELTRIFHTDLLRRPGSESDAALKFEVVDSLGEAGFTPSGLLESSLPHGIPASGVLGQYILIQLLSYFIARLTP